MRLSRTLILNIFAVLILASCSSSSTPNAPTNSEGVFYSGCGYEYSQKPSSITLTCADGSMYLDQVKYTKWNDTSAKASGIFNMNSCDPDCASGTMIATPVEISIGKPKQDSNGKMIFSELIIRAQKKLYNGLNSATFDIGIEPEMGSDTTSSEDSQSQPEPMDPAQATQSLLDRLNSSNDLWEINEAATSSVGQMSHRRLGLYTEPDYVIQCNLPMSGTWLFVYSDENSAYEAFNSEYFFRTSYYSAQFTYDPVTNLLVLLHTSMGGNKICINSAYDQLTLYATD